MPICQVQCRYFEGLSARRINAEHAQLAGVLRTDAEFGTPRM
jgi:hypothetical protein